VEKDFFFFSVESTRSRLNV